MDAPVSSEALLQLLTELMAEIHPQAASHAVITLDCTLDNDLGLDSLSRMELLTRLEKAFHVHLPESVLVSVATPRELLRHLQQAQVRAEAGTSCRPNSKTDSSSDASDPELKTVQHQQLNLQQAETLVEVLDQHACHHPEANHITVLSEGNETGISYGELQKQSLKVANALRENLVEPGQTVALMLPTSPDYFFCFFGVLYSGAIPVPLYPPARPNQLEEHIRRHRKILANAGAKTLITIAEAKPLARLLMSHVPELERIFIVDELYQQQANALPKLCHPNDTAFLQYTSGSTGDPKGVVLTHQNLLTNIRAMGRVCEVTDEDVFVSWLPLYHDMGLIGAWLGSLYFGCRLVVMSPLSFLARPLNWLKAIHQYKGTLSASPNFGFELCTTRLSDDDLQNIDLSSWRLAFNGAEPVIPQTLQAFAVRFQSCGFDPKAIAPVYGLAESSVGLAFPKPGLGARVDRVKRGQFESGGMAITTNEIDSEVLEFVCCGAPLPGHQIRIVDDDNRELPERQQGRMQFKGPSSTSGYFRNPAQTKKLFCEEWLDSGDLAYIAEGELYLTCRQKDIIIRAGRNLYPHELEQRVGEIDDIRKGCTAVFASQKPGDRLEQLIVLTESRQTEPERLNELKKSITSATIDLLGLGPDDIVIGPPGTVLKTSSGKIRRSACKQLYESGHIGRSRAAVWLQLIRTSLAGLWPLTQRLWRKLAEQLFAVRCWTSLGIIALPTWIGAAALPSEISRWNWVKGCAKLASRLSGIRISIRGQEHLHSQHRCLLVSNHMSYLDSLALAAALPPPCHFVGKKELGENPLLKLAMDKLGIFLVERFDAEQSLTDTQAIADGLKQGKRPLFFAEGTLQRMPGLLPFQLGAFMLACQQQVSIVPITLRGSRNILRGNSWFPRRGLIQIQLHPAVDPQGDDWKAAVALRDQTRATILKSLHEPDLAGEYTSLRQMDIERNNDNER